MITFKGKVLAVPQYEASSVGNYNLVTASLGMYRTCKYINERATELTRPGLCLIVCGALAILSGMNMCHS